MGFPRKRKMVEELLTVGVLDVVFLAPHCNLEKQKRPRYFIFQFISATIKPRILWTMYGRHQKKTWIERKMLTTKDKPSGTKQSS